MVGTLVAATGDGSSQAATLASIVGELRYAIELVERSGLVELADPLRAIYREVERELAACSPLPDLA